ARRRARGTRGPGSGGRAGPSAHPAGFVGRDLAGVVSPIRRSGRTRRRAISRFWRRSGIFGLCRWHGGAGSGASQTRQTHALSRQVVTRRDGSRSTSRDVSEKLLIECSAYLFVRKVRSAAVSITRRFSARRLLRSCHRRQGRHRSVTNLTQKSARL